MDYSQKIKQIFTDLKDSENVSALIEEGNRLYK